MVEAVMMMRFRRWNECSVWSRNSTMSIPRRWFVDRNYYSHAVVWTVWSELTGKRKSRFPEGLEPGQPGQSWACNGFRTRVFRRNPWPERRQAQMLRRCRRLHFFSRLPQTSISHFSFFFLSTIHVTVFFMPCLKQCPWISGEIPFTFLFNAYASLKFKLYSSKGIVLLAFAVDDM